MNMTKVLKNLSLIVFIVSILFTLTACKDGSDHKHSYDMTSFESNDLEHWYKCKNCEEVNNRQLHVFSAAIQVSATYENVGYLSYTCVSCGYEKRVVNEAKLTHQFGLNYKADDVNHWHECLDEGYADLKEGLEPHTFDTGVQINATFDNAGYISYTCTTCGYVKKETNQNQLKTFL